MVSFQQMGIVMSIDGVLWNDREELVPMYRNLLRDYTRFGYQTVILTDRKDNERERVRAKLMQQHFEFGSIIFQLRTSDLSGPEFKAHIANNIQSTHFDIMGFFDSDAEAIEAVGKHGISTNLVCLR